MSENELVSVIIPIYKKEDVLDRCVASVLAQKYKNLEVLLIDDGSPDACGSMCDAWAAKDNRIKIFHQENQGVSAARNKGLSEAAGDFITFVDADDVLDGDFLSALLQQFADDSIQVVIGGNRSAKKPFCLRLDSKSAVRLMFDDDNFGVNIWGKVYRASLLQNLRFPLGIKMGEDLFFLFSVLLSCKSVIYSSENFYHQCVSKYNSNNLVGYEQFYNAFCMCKQCEELAFQHNFSLAECLPIKKACVIRAVWTIDVMAKRAAIDTKCFDICRTYIQQNKNVLLYLPLSHKLRAFFILHIPSAYVVFRG